MLRVRPTTVLGSMRIAASRAERCSISWKLGGAVSRMRYTDGEGYTATNPKNVFRDALRHEVLGKAHHPMARSNKFLATLDQSTEGERRRETEIFCQFRESNDYEAIGCATGNAHAA
uniref:Uncharacterized protein n=1 Tax=Fusarium oxysporum (strain Fo5176) TaxID=660025 RepID=A0A0D2Y852_FUSOF